MMTKTLLPLIVLGTVSGPLLAHQHPSLLDHLHPHLGVEHLGLATIVAVLGYGLLRAIARRG